MSNIISNKAYGWMRCFVIGLCFSLMMIGLVGCGRADQALSVPGSAESIFSEEKNVAQTLADTSVETQSLEIQADHQVDPRADSDAVSQKVICVYVCGAVQEPRVVELPEGSRAQDALAAAGGFAEDADTAAVNLAGVLSDGQKLYFPTETEPWTENMPPSADDGSFVNINTADVAQLCTLPGIGQSRAEAIIAYRQQNGAFVTVSDIMKVSGIKEGAFEKIKDLITVK